jgi:hypothetical protein
MTYHQRDEMTPHIVLTTAKPAGARTLSEFASDSTIKARGQVSRPVLSLHSGVVKLLESPTRELQCAAAPLKAHLKT